MEARTIGICAIAVIIIFVGGAMISAFGVRAKINDCENRGGVWHQNSCMKSEYFLDLEK